LSFFVLAFVAGLGFRWLTHRTGGLSALNLRATPLVFAGLALQFAPALGAYPKSALIPGLLASYALIALWLVVNVRLQRGVYRGAFALLAAGWLLNFIPIAANRGMPVSAWASAKASAPNIPHRGAMVKHVVADSSSPARVLGDVIPVAPLHAVISFGDIVLALGVAAIAGGEAEADRRSIGSRRQRLHRPRLAFSDPSSVEAR
jgi:hypothetical protein